MAWDAAYDTNAVLKHYFEHKNTAPFLTMRMIELFGTSNPTPDYEALIKKGYFELYGVTFTWLLQLFFTKNQEKLSIIVELILIRRKIRDQKKIEKILSFILLCS